MAGEDRPDPGIHVHGPECRHGHDDHVRVPTRNPTRKLGRNDPCHCGSGKKFKKCHGT